MKKLTLLSLCLIGILVKQVNAQKASDLSNFTIKTDDLKSESAQSLISDKLKNSQFTFVGEQHGIKSPTHISQMLFEMGQKYGYNTFVIETDHLAAEKLAEMTASGNHLEANKKANRDFPFAIPFYSNEDDVLLFEKIHDLKGQLWGIDQTFITEFRLTFQTLADRTESNELKKKVLSLKMLADEAYKEAVETKNPMAPYIFQYDEDTHQSLMFLAQTEYEKFTIGQLWNTKEIYDHNFAKRYYQNNNVRGQLMKSNFMRYYREALSQNQFPKAVFKLGANHAAKGLTRTNIYDISNLGSELAISNGMRSVHVAVLGLTGEAAVGNPFAPSPYAPFDNTGMLPEELKTATSEMAEKYFVLDTEPMRDFGYGNTYSEEMKKLIFKYDLIILVNGAEALKMFED